ncbi:hypothetical protein PBAL39_14254 [Pedobacter sp. BAL39]|uniref:hypothetical protein n=1 Tax=Pedobacter sp. BAL39 TaxID=391596 RepID=UPI000155AD5B|nr:hypothetical protein [Pedobacter sp. BAL39]EDM34726.1 hypothetical protein PBAL39_14254 [Pedobacter sp. BAL39]
MRIFYLLFITGALFSNATQSQEVYHTTTSASTATIPSAIALQESEHESEKDMFRLTLSMGHAHIRKTIQHHHGSDISSAAWALDADYWISNHLALGIHNDIILENFIIEEHLGNNEYALLEREYPIAVVAVILYKPWHHLSILAGAGTEFSREKNLMVFRSGLEYGWKLPHTWELGMSTNYDIKRSHDTWMLGFGVSKFIGGHQ